MDYTSGPLVYTRGVKLVICGPLAALREVHCGPPHDFQKGKNAEKAIEKYQIYKLISRHRVARYELVGLILFSRFFVDLFVDFL